jgi:murein L,D-transpeptidase YcbB/YkuD
MFKASSLVACASLAATLAILGAAPVPAQTAPGGDTRLPRVATAPNIAQPPPPAETKPAPLPPPAEVAPPPPAEAAPPAQPEAAQPPLPAREESATTPPAPDAAIAPPVVEIDPLLAQVREVLASKKLRGVVQADRAAAVAFYGERTATVWVTAEGYAVRAHDAMAEIAKAGDWGLSAAAFELPPADLADRSPAALADAEIKLSLAVLEYARHARGGRLDPSRVSRNFDQKPPLRDPRQVLQEVAATDAPAGYLRDLHPKHPQFGLLRQALLKVRAGAAAESGSGKPEKLVRIPDGPTLKLGMQHAHVRLLRQRLRLPLPDGAEDAYDLGVQEAVAAFQKTKGIRSNGQLNPRTRGALNNVETQRPVFGSEEQRLIVNMERWRWMPEDMGEFHVWDNIPEYQTRVLKRGQWVHQAKIIVGRAETQTVIFSANMRYVIFGPEWGVPDSIKINEILPYLRPSMDSGGFFGFGSGATDTRILEKHNLRVSQNGKPVDASQIDWSSVDIKKYNFIQPSGPGNVLGAVKFRFPNRHDIYMHDTPQRELFDKAVRTFSHGCIRVHNPGRFAEVLLEEDRGWSAARVKDMMAKGGNVEVSLTKQIPVHITYFTMVAGEDGQVRSFGDVYGHDKRVSAALSGRPMPLEPPPMSSATPKQERKEKEARRPRSYASDDVFSGLFGN